MHNSWSLGIFANLYGINNVLCNINFVECRRGTNHSDARDGFLCKGQLPQTLQMEIIGLKGSDGSRDKLWFGAPQIQVPFYPPEPEAGS